MKIIIASRAINPPWTESTKIIIKELITNIKKFNFLVAVGGGFSFNKSNIEEYSVSKGRHPVKITLYNRFRIISNLLTAKDSDACHLFAKPKKSSSKIIKNLAKLNKIKTIQTITNSHTEINKELYFADEIVVISKYAKNKLKKQGISSTLIYPGINEKDLKSRIKNKKLKNKNTVIYPGDLTSRNSINILTNIVKETVKKDKNVKFIFAIRDKDRKSSSNKTLLKKELKENKLSSNVRIMDHVSDIIGLINSCDLVIFPIKSIEQKLEIPLVLIESLALKKPILISNLKPLDEILPLKAGLIINPDKPKEYASSIVKLLNDKKSLKKSGDLGLKIVKQRFDSKRMVEEYKKVYKKIQKQTKK